MTSHESLVAVHTHTHTHTHHTFIKRVWNHLVNLEKQKNQQDNTIIHRQKGITLIALVVTLVILLILAAITLNLLFNTKLFEKAQQSEDAYKIGALKDQISTIILDWELEKKIPNTTGDETIGTLDRLWDKFVDADIIDNPDEDIYHQEGTDIYEVTTNEGYVVEIIVKEDGTVEIGDIVKEDNLPPRIGEITSSGTSSSIHVEVTITRSEGEPSLSYYYKKEGEAEESYIPLKENVEDLTADFTGLEQNVVYNIKVIAKDDNGSTEKVINQLTGELAEGTIRQVGDPEWNNGTATLRLETSETGVDIVYQVGNIDGTWLPYPEEGISGLNHEDIVYAAISDGTNVSKESSFEIKDGIAPTVTITQGTITTKSIAVTVSATDREWGMPEPPTYNYYIKKSTENSYPSTASYTGINTSYTFDNLSQTTSYDIKVTTVDKAGNEGSKELTGVSTGTIGGATGNLVSGNIIASNPTWSGGKASITLSKGTGVASNLSIQWQKGSITGEWTTGTSVTGLNHNDIVYARLTDGINHGQEASVTIKDTGAPTAATIELSSTSVNTGTTVTATVTLNDSQSGPNITSCRYIWNTSSAKLGTNASSYTGGAFSSNGQKISRNMSSTGTYYLHVLTVDKGGNALETVSNAISVRQLVTGISISPTTVSLQVNKTQQLTANITPANATNPAVSWKSSNTGVATVSTTGLVTAKAEGTVTITATTTDGTNKSATCKVTVSYPTASSIVSSGDYIDYPESSTNGWRVLYPSNSKYGLQIIGTVGNVILYKESEYQDLINILNRKAEAYLNTTYGTEARCVGSNPADKDAESDDYYYSSRYYFEEYNYKYKDADENYITDFNQLEAMGLLNIGTSYWLASRVVASDNSRTALCANIVNSSGEWDYAPLFTIRSNGETFESSGQVHKLRPVIKLKTNLKVIGGNGTSSNPWKLGT